MTNVFVAKTVFECWTIARNVAEEYQQRANNAETPDLRSYYLAARNAADKVALLIRNGEKRER